MLLSLWMPFKAAWCEQLSGVRSVLFTLLFLCDRCRKLLSMPVTQWLLPHVIYLQKPLCCYCCVEVSDDCLSIADGCARCEGSDLLDMFCGRPAKAHWVGKTRFRLIFETRSEFSTKSILPTRTHSWIFSQRCNQCNSPVLLPKYSSDSKFKLIH